MKIESVRIENFRCFKDETIRFDNYTCLIGANGSGKSTVFSSLNIFFKNNKDSQTNLNLLSADDFHHKITKEPIRITITFSNLSDKAKEELSDYVRQNKLIVSAIAEYNTIKENAEVVQFGNRLGFTDFRKYFEAVKQEKKSGELQNI